MNSKKSIILRIFTYKSISPQASPRKIEIVFHPKKKIGTYISKAKILILFNVFLYIKLNFLFKVKSFLAFTKKTFETAIEIIIIGTINIRYAILNKPHSIFE